MAAGYHAWFGATGNRFNQSSITKTLESNTKSIGLPVPESRYEVYHDLKIQSRRKFEGHLTQNEDEYQKYVPKNLDIVLILSITTVSFFDCMQTDRGERLWSRPFLRPSFGGNPLEFGDEIWRQKTRVMGLTDGEEIMTQYRRVTQTDRRTDRRTRCDRYYPR